MSEGKPPCRNCQAILYGEYCSQCGQREGRSDLLFSELVGELLGDFVRLDSRVWRTLLCLLFRPGFLSAEFMAGRKARYLPPLRLYLIISFILFLVLSLVTGGDLIVVGDQEPAAVASEQAAEAEGQSPEEDGDAGLDIQMDLADDDSPLWLQDFERLIDDKAVQVQADPGKLLDRMLEYLPQMMFLLLPVFALLVRVSYAFSPFHYLQHLVFALHYHSFAYVLYLLDMVLERFVEHSDGLFFLLLLVYLPLALRSTYHSSFAAAIGKTLFIYLAYVILLGVGIVGLTLVALTLM